MPLRLTYGRSTLFCLAASLLLAGTTAGAVEDSFLEFTDVRKQTGQFLHYYHQIELTPAQERMKDAALARLPAPCCNDRTAATCCCECNMAKAWWGLTKHLIADRGYSADEVTETVAEWFSFISPSGSTGGRAGFSGDACYTGGCARAFSQNGCGGMTERQLVF